MASPLPGPAEAWVAEGAEGADGAEGAESPDRFGAAATILTGSRCDLTEIRHDPGRPYVTRATPSEEHPARPITAP